ncbi:ABC transporter permease [Pandoraea communis]|uniref:Binding-protein-dependent transport system inner membrane protein n=1 Tax=Pandoraea communis TaxID=2508297 RepID=A0A5E4RER5_9BURK|nr:ABC transporter permease [Pandoraea communis]MDM8355823.1 ABC transporter permease [Pandoraea communis]VVD61323.1 binding-protein-dependent transport system inner membrane protein [Pandoraea communis]VVD64517.1 binding-protein-dependent transport system inner membrane protein [Pandoraea communis]
MKAQVQRLVAARFGLALLTLLIVSAIVFTITALLPGDAAQMALGQAATPEAVTALRHQLGLDQPAITRYFQWLAHMFAGNFGDSMSNNLPVAQLIATRLPNSLVLAGLTTLVSVPLALGIGVAAAMWRGSLLDRALNVLTLAVVAVPEFLVATVAVLIFAVKLRWLPALSYLSSVNSFDDLLRIYAMPVMTLCCVIVAQMARMTRAAVIDQLSSSYVEMAVLKGASPIRIVWRHVLPNAVGPIANAVALSLSYLFGGVVIVESIFNYPGLASLLVDAVTNRDLPLVQGCVMVFCTAYLALVLIADLCAVVSNPRLRQR